MHIEEKGYSCISELVLPSLSSPFQQTQVGMGSSRPEIHGILCVTPSELGGNDIRHKC